MTLVQRRAVTRCAVVLLLYAMVPGCMPGPSVETSGTTRAQLLAEARGNYTYGAERNAEPVTTTRITASGGMLPGITIATATRISTTGRRPSSRFLGRLTVTGGAYERMGLAPGVNYLWRDSTTGPGPSSYRQPGRSFLATGLAHDPARTLIVPADPAYPMRWLQHDADHAPLSASASALPRLVMSTNGYGVCDNGCGGGHCVAIQAMAGAVSDPAPTVIGP